MGSIRGAGSGSATGAMACARPRAWRGSWAARWPD